MLCEDGSNGGNKPGGRDVPLDFSILELVEKLYFDLFGDCFTLSIISFGTLNKTLR